MYGQPSSARAAPAGLTLTVVTIAAASLEWSLATDEPEQSILDEAPGRPSESLLCPNTNSTS